MRPMLGMVAVVIVAAGAQVADARGRDARNFSLPHYDEMALDGMMSAPNYDSRALDRMIDARAAPGGNVMNWRFSEGSASDASGAVDGWAMAWAAADESLPPGLAATLTSQLSDQSFELDYRREWPGLIAGSAGGYDFDVSPHAGIGVSNAGHSAEAGAMIRVGDLDGAAWMARRLRRLGLAAADGRSFGARGRWYLFAAISGASMGINMLRDPLDGGWRAAGLSADSTAAFVTVAQAGVAWRQGGTQASLGYIRRSIHLDAPMPEAYPSSEDAVALSFAVKPEF